MDGNRAGSPETMVFLRAADTARTLLDHPDLDARWAGPSVLEAMSLAELCGHLSRAVTVVPRYLDTPGLTRPVDAPGYFLGIDGIRAPNLAGERATAIRARGGEAAAGGASALRAEWDDARSILGERLATEDGRAVIAVMGSSMAVPDYLVTRTLELVVHADDLAVTLGVPTPEFAPSVYEAVLACLWDMARRRHDPIDLVRAMTRVERDVVQALRVL